MLADRRPLTTIMDDYIPYGRWAMELYLLKQKGFKSWRQYLRIMNSRKRSSKA